MASRKNPVPPTSKKSKWASLKNNWTLARQPTIGDTVPEKAIYDSSLRSLTTSFLGNTSAHGIPRVLNSKTLYRKLMWVVVLACALTYFLYQTTTLFTTFYDYPTSIKNEVNTKLSYEFPSVTVCNMNVLKKSLLSEVEKYDKLVTIDMKTKKKVQETVDDIFYERRRKQIIENSGELGIPESQLDRYKRNLGTLASPEEDLDTDLTAYETDSPNEFKTEAPPVSQGWKGLHGQKREDEDEGEDDHLGSGEYYWRAWSERYVGEDNWYENWYQEIYDDMGFGDISGDYEFDSFMNESATDDYSDLVDVLKPTKEELDMYGHRAEDFIILCSFDKKNCSYTDFAVLRNGFYGNCFTFNHAEGENATVKRTSKYGSRYGLRITLNIEYDQYLGLFSHNSGARVTVHPFNVTPFPEDYGFSAGPGKETEIGVNLETIKRLKHPYNSNCTNGEHVTLNYPGLYTVLACSQTCLQNKLEDRCGCINTILELVNATRCLQTNKTQERCRQLIHHMYDKAILGCDCPPACNETLYPVSISSSDWPSDPYTWLLTEKLLQKDERLVINEDNRDNIDRNILFEIKSNISKNMVRIHVYIQSPNSRTIEEYPSYPWDKLVADIGGLLSLFIGVSVLTAVEIMEFITDAIVLSCKQITNRLDRKAEPDGRSAQGGARDVERHGVAVEQAGSSTGFVSVLTLTDGHSVGFGHDRRAFHRFWPRRTVVPSVLAPADGHLAGFDLEQTPVGFSLYGSRP